MIVRRSITRRRLTLAGISIGLFGCISAYARAPFNWASPGETPAYRVLASLSEDWRRARSVGRAYLEMIGCAEASPGRLMAMIFPESSSPDVIPNSAREIREMVNDHVRREFSEGSVVTVDGWILAITEARIYALAALL
jgi:hypothetical protein